MKNGKEARKEARRLLGEAVKIMARGWGLNELPDIANECAALYKTTSDKVFNGKTRDNDWLLANDEVSLVHARLTELRHAVEVLTVAKGNASRALFDLHEVAI